MPPTIERQGSTQAIESSGRLGVRVAIFLALQFLVLASLGWGYSRNEHALLGAARQKHALLDASGPPRLILVGGSSVLYGLDSPTLAETSGLSSVINMALTAPLGLELMLNEVRGHLAEGDVVLLSFEYEHFCTDVVSARDLIWLLEQRPISLEDMGVDQLKLVLDRSLYHLGSVLRSRSWDGPRAHDPIHDIAYINRYGDSTVSQHVDEVAAPIPTLLDCDLGRSGLIATQVEKLRSFTTEAAANGAEVYYAHPPLEARSFESAQADIAVIHRRLSEALPGRLLSEPVEATHPVRDMLDSNYHLRHAPKLRRSRLLGDRILERQKRVEPRGIEPLTS